jgi:AcrR family transcriptional regulator
MDNATRSERTRQAGIKAAFAIISRDGLAGLTFDALTRESGLSKGGLLHQFGTKKGIIEALLDHQSRYFKEFKDARLSPEHASTIERELHGEISFFRDTLGQPAAAHRAILSLLVQDQDRVQGVRASCEATLRGIRNESSDGDIAVLRWIASVGIALTSLLELSPLQDEERENLFNRLLDEQAWARTEPNRE